MARLNMEGPYKLDTNAIDKKITQKKEGNYALGKLNDQEHFIPKYVGRSDSDVGKRIKDHLEEGYTHFMFSYATSPKAAFLKECNNYHDFERQLHNKRHPDRPDNSKDWNCPQCDIYG